MEHVVIVGARLRVPGANSPEELWANALAGRSGIADLSDDELAASGIDARTRRAPGYVARAGSIDGIDELDHALFDYSFREAQHLDPQQRLLLTLSHQLLEDVGPTTRNVGVFASVGFPSYLVQNLLPARADAGLSAMGNSSHSSATRISYKLNLTGPAFGVECGCSSSLVALHMARIAILTGQCEMALVGGCSLRVPVKQGYAYQRDSVLSRDGVCRPFDAHADGTIFTSGGVVVAVKKLSAALQDGDDIWGVVLGTAVNNDGSTKAGFTAPSLVGQREVIHRVYARAGVSPRSVGYVEAHGTGTAMGDPLEHQALTEAFAAFTADRGFCSLGSIKANVGHLDAAAGLVGVVKAALCLKHRQTPPLAGFSQVNPKIDLAASPFFIQTEARRWDAPAGEPRRAAVSSLGVGGTNAHALLEEPPPRPAGLAASWGLVVLSASKPADLEARTAAIAAAAQARPDEIGDIAYTSQLAPARYAERAAWFVDASAPAAVDGKPLRPTGDFRRRDLILAFPGQGMQYEAMGRELRDHVPAFRAAFDRVAAMFRAAGAADPLALLGEGAAAIARTEALQPYLFSVEYALGRVVLDLGVRPAAMLGHSLGEYVAATLAGVFELETAVRVVTERARLMGAAPRGAMLVVHAGEAAARAHLRDGISICVVNGARSVVLGGAHDAVDALAAELARAGQPTTRLDTSHAFHSHLMAGAAEAFERALAGVALAPPQLPIVSNLDGRSDDPRRFTEPSYWARHLREPVRFHECLRTVAGREAPSVVLELGPGRSVSSMFAASFPDREVAVLSSLARGRERAGLFGLIATLWLNGVAIDLRGLYREARGRIAALPAAPLAPRRCWIDAPSSSASSGAGPLAKQDAIADWLYEQRWSPRPASDAALAPSLAASAMPSPMVDDIAVVSTARAAGVAIAGALERAGARVVSIDLEDVAHAALDGAALDRALADRLGGRELNRAVLVLADPPAAPDAATATRGVLIALALARRVRAATREAGELVLVAEHGVRTTTEPVHWWHAWIDGFTTVACQEAPGLAVRYVDVDHGGLAAGDPLVARAILAGDDRVCAVRGGLIWEREIRAVRRPARPAAPQPIGRVLVLGGTGNLGLVYARYFLRAGATAIALVSRGATDVAHRLAGGDVPDQRIWARRRRLVDDAARAGVDLSFISADASQAADLARAVDEARQRFGGLDAIVHASGAAADLHFKPLFETDRSILEPLYHAKLEIARSLDRIARAAGVPRVLAVSSISGVLGGLGFMAYTTSHNLLDAYAAATSDAACRWSTIAWDAWDFYKDEQAADAVDLGIGALAISEDEGLEALGAIHGAAWPSRIIVSSGDLHRRHASWVLRDASAAEPRIELGERPTLREDYVEPTGEIARRLAALWGDAIGVRTVGVRDNFFELGGDSLIAVSLIERINRALGRDVSVMEIFKYPTVEKLAGWLEAAPAAATPIAPAHPPGDAPALAEPRATGRSAYFEARRRRAGGGS